MEIEHIRSANRNLVQHDASPQCVGVFGGRETDSKTAGRPYFLPLQSTFRSFQNVRSNRASAAPPGAIPTKGSAGASARM